MSVTEFVSSRDWQHARRETLRFSPTIRSEGQALEPQDFRARGSVLPADGELHHHPVLAGAADRHVGEPRLVLRPFRELRLERVVLFLPADPVRVEMLDDEAQRSFVFLDGAKLVEAGLAVGLDVAEVAEHHAGPRRAHQRLDLSAVAVAGPVTLEPGDRIDLRGNGRRILRRSVFRLRVLRLRMDEAREGNGEGGNDGGGCSHPRYATRVLKLCRLVPRP